MSRSKPKILFLCTGNSCRSQMAEGWVRRLYPDRFEPLSAGTAPGRVDPRAMAVMREVGVDLSTHRSKHVDEVRDQVFDCVVTVCDQARESCPVFAAPGLRIHAGFDDPPRLVRGAPTEEEALAAYRRVRDEIRAFVETLARRLSEGSRDSDGA